MAAMFKVPLGTGLRRLFYAVTPNETSFESHEDVPRYIDESTPFFFLLIIIEAILCHIKNVRAFRMNDLISSVGGGVMSQLPQLFIRAIEYSTYLWVYQHFNLISLPWNSAWTWWLCFLGVDFGYYWFHRFAHEVNIMWAAHQVHHSSEDYNLTTALRQSVFQRYTSWVFYVPLATFVPPPIYMAHIQFNILYQFWIHTELINNLGPLEYILNTPSHHRVHHGRNPYCIDKNYAGTLIIWDRLFGTFQAEGEEVVYGLTHPVNSWNPFKIQLCHLQHIWHTLFQTEGFENKLYVLLKGPGWAPGKPRLGDPEDIPKVKAPIKRYNSHISFWWDMYVFSHFALLLIGYQEVVARKTGLTTMTLLIFVGYLLMSLTSFGALFDQRPYGPYLETLRCLLFVVGDFWFTNLGLLSTRPVWLYILQWYFIFSMCLWGHQCLRMMGVKSDKLN